MTDPATRRNSLSQYPDAWASNRQDQFSLIPDVRYAAQDPDDTATYHLQGRIALKRNAGKIVFATITGFENTPSQIQVFLSPQHTTPENVERFKKHIHIGDIAFFTGHTGLSTTGEPTLFVSEWELDAKCLHDLPRLLHNKDTGDVTVSLNKETTSGDPVKHLLTNSAHRQRTQARFRMIQQVRDHFRGLGFLEVDTPTLNENAGGASAERFSTQSKHGKDLYLRVASELHLKRLVIGGYGPVFEIGKNYRNEGSDRTHIPEFMALEAYLPGSNYRAMMEVTSGLLRDLLPNDEALERIQVTSFYDALEEAGVSTLPDYDNIMAFAEQKGLLYEGMDLHAEEENLYDSYMEHLFDKHVVPTFAAGQWQYIIDYPPGPTPLARAREGVAEKWDLYYGNMEIATAYTENTNPITQAKTLPDDQDFVRDLGYGLPSTGGLGIGLDRLAMVVTGSERINDVLAFSGGTL